MADKKFNFSIGDILPDVGFAFLVLALLALWFVHQRLEMEVDCLSELPSIEQREQCRLAVWGR